MFRYVGERDDDVLVDEDEQGQEEAQARSAERVPACQLVEGGEVEHGAVVDIEHRNCSRGR